MINQPSNEFLLVDIHISFSKKDILSKMDELVVKELAFSKKEYGILKGYTTYKNILIPYGNFSKTVPTQIEKVFSFIDTSNSIYDAIWYYLSKIDIDVGYLASNIAIDCEWLVDDDLIDIFYSDGSFSNNGNIASYASIMLEDIDDNGVFDVLTGNKYTYSVDSAAIVPGTNNIGELTGIKKCLEIKSDKPFKVIISDSEYSLKCLREWIHNWQKNGFKTAAGKPVKNIELIKAMHQIMSKPDSETVMFMWTRGHNDTPFNELCDRFAKEAIEDYVGEE